MPFRPFARLERRLLYPSSATLPVRRPATVTLSRAGATLGAWVAGEGQAPAVLYLGGNGERVEDSVDGLAASLPGHAVWAISYRGYGPSGGMPSESALVADALAWYDELVMSHGRVAVVGRSLGSGIAAQLAVARSVERLVLITPFDSMLRVAADVAGWVPVGWLIHDRYESVRFAPGLACPILVIGAAEDELVRPAWTRALVAACPSVTREIVIAGRGHNDLQEDPAYDEALREFLG